MVCSYHIRISGQNLRLATYIIRVAHIFLFYYVWVKCAKISLWNEVELFNSAVTSHWNVPNGSIALAYT